MDGTRTSLAGRCAWVTGGSSGIGAAVALECARMGASVVLGARRTDRLSEVAATIAREVPGAKVAWSAVDVTDDASLDAWLAEAAKTGPCDVLVNNAGLALGRQRIDEADLGLWDTMLDVNVKAAFHVTRKVINGMIARGTGDVVMMASVAGFEPYAGGSVYSASKAALQAFTRSLRAELLGKDIRVLQFDPGLVETEFSLVRYAGDAAAAKKVYDGMRPLTAVDVAECVAFALSRPRHVSLDTMMIMATDQLGGQAVFRR